MYSICHNSCQLWKKKHAWLGQIHLLVILGSTYSRRKKKNQVCLTFPSKVREKVSKGAFRLSAKIQYLARPD